MTLRDKLNNLLILATIDGERREILKKGILEIIEESMPEELIGTKHDGWNNYRTEMLRRIKE